VLSCPLTATSDAPAARSRVTARSMSGSDNGRHGGRGDPSSACGRWLGQGRTPAAPTREVCRTQAQRPAASPCHHPGAAVAVRYANAGDQGSPHLSVGEPSGVRVRLACPGIQTCLSRRC
jgi:hypothetical protein